MIRDRIVFATNSAKVLEKLFCHGLDLSLEKVIDIACLHEVSQQQLKTMLCPSAATQAAHAVNANKPSRADQLRRGGRQAGGANSSSAVRSKECGACGREHSHAEECPAKGRQCNKCKKFNHFAKMCRTQAPQRQLKHRQKGMHAIMDDVEEHPTDALYIDAIVKQDANTQREQAFAEVELGENGRKVKFKLDTGAQTNIIPAKIFEEMFGKTALAPPTEKLSAYNGQLLKVKGNLHAPAQ